MTDEPPTGESEAPQPGAPLAIEQLIGHRRPSDPRMAPDGSRIAYVLREVSKEGEHETAAIWIVGASDGDPQQFTSGLWLDEEPRWSPDGVRLAFLSDRAERGKKSVYVMPAGGGEALRVWDQQGDMEQLSWAPDGRRLAVLFTDPETEEEKKRREERDDAHEWDTDYKYQRLWVIDPETRTARVVSPEARQDWGYAWAPAADRLGINTTATPRVDDMFRETDVSLVATAGGGATPLFQQVGLAEDLVWSADGTTLAYRAPAGRVVNGDYVYKRPIAGGDAVCLTAGYEGTSEYLTGVGGGESLLLLASEGVNSALYRLTWEGKRERLPAGEPWGAMTAWAGPSAEGEVVAVVWSEGVHAPDVWVARHDISQLVQRTHLNPDLEAAALGAVEVVRWPSDPGV